MIARSLLKFSSSVRRAIKIPHRSTSAINLATDDFLQSCDEAALKIQVIQSPNEAGRMATELQELFNQVKNRFHLIDQPRIQALCNLALQAHSQMNYEADSEAQIHNMRVVLLECLCDLRETYLISHNQ